jgi:hypothetical protein
VLKLRREHPRWSGSSGEVLRCLTNGDYSDLDDLANDRTALPRCDENRPQLCTAVDAAQITKEIKCWSRQYNQPIRARLADHPGSARYIARGGS